MLTTYGSMNAGKIHYDASGTATAADEDAYLAEVAARRPDDLFVISHGWNDDESDADDLYGKFFAAIDNVRGRFPTFDIAKAFTLAVIWPSRKFDENAFAAAAGKAPPTTGDAAGGAAALGADAVDTAIAAQLQALKSVQPDAATAAHLDRAIAQIPLLSVSRSAQDDYVAAIASAFPAAGQSSDPGVDDAIANLGQLQGHDVLANIVNATNALPPASPIGTDELGGAALTGGALGFDPIAAIKNAALVLANLTTYWTMKNRAGVIGQTGVVQTLAKAMLAAPDAKVHLIGHSFGGRLVTSVANALTGGAPGHQVSTMLLLQAAYSHFGMAQNYQPGHDGAFRDVITGRKVASQIQITHSKWDIAVGLAYPMASAVAHQVADAFFVNPFGGMGADGARSTPEAFDDTLGAVGTAYAAPQGTQVVRNLNGDAIIKSHTDVTHDEIAYAALTAVVRA